jgi:hypothetical protein
MAPNILAIGSNAPPGDSDPLAERLVEQYANLHDRARDLLEAEARLPDSLTDETVGRVSDFARQIKACVKAAQEAHKAEKSDYLAKCTICDAWLNGLKAPLLDLGARVERRVAAFLAAKESEERRKREEEARRLAAEAKELAAAGDKEQAKEARAEARDLRQEARTASAADMARVHTGMGGVATLKAPWAFDGIDRLAIDLETLRPYLPLDGIEKAVRAYIRAGGRELKGVRIFQDRKALIR